MFGHGPMDETRYVVRDFRDSDYDAIAAIHNAVAPESPISAEFLRHIAESFSSKARPYRLVVGDRPSGDAVGTSSLFQMPFENDPARPWFNLEVLPSHQRDGVGSYLYDALLSEAKHRGASGLRCNVREGSAEGRRFLAKRGFVERRRTWRSSLEVAAADTSRLPSLTRTISAGGIELTTLSKEGTDDPGVLHRLYDLESETGRDVPRVGAYTPLSFEQFRHFFLEGQSALPEGWMLAKDGERYIGTSSAAREPAQPDVLQQYFTGTRPEYRRRKIALALKLMLIDFAKRNGYARIETSNDSLNEPIWALNRSLGFRKVREVIQLECEFERGVKE